MQVRELAEITSIIAAHGTKVRGALRGGAFGSCAQRGCTLLSRQAGFTQFPGAALREQHILLRYTQ